MCERLPAMNRNQFYEFHRIKYFFLVAFVWLPRNFISGKRKRADNKETHGTVQTKASLFMCARAIRDDAVSYSNAKRRKRRKKKTPITFTSHTDAACLVLCDCHCAPSHIPMQFHDSITCGIVMFSWIYVVLCLRKL